MLSILDVKRDAQLFGALFDGPSWTAWNAADAAVFGLPPSSAEEADIIRRCTGRTALPSQPAREAWFICGRRSGKSRIAAVLAVYLACFRDYRHVLARGERGTLMVIASDRRQARVTMRFIVGLLQATPMLAKLIVRRTQDVVDLRNQVSIEIHTASFRATRGYTVVGCVLDEIAFWPNDDSANPDSEIINALRPAMATVPDALLVAISSPYARRGELWRAYREHYGRDEDPVLVWRADTRTMNPTVPQGVIDRAYADDEAVASAEYGAEFRRDIEALFARDVVDAAVVPGRRELPAVPGVAYVAFVDPSGGSADSMTLAIAHHEQGRAVLDVIRERRPPFSPDAVVQDFAALLKGYGLATVTGDRYGGEWPRERFAAHGITYQVADAAKSDLYLALLPLLNSGQLDLLDEPRLVSQLSALERRTTRGRGRDAVDHPPNSHDDVANAVAGVLVLAGARPIEPVGCLLQPDGDERPIIDQGNFLFRRRSVFSDDHALVRLRQRRTGR